MDSIPAIADGVPGVIDAGRFEPIRKWDHLPLLFRSRLAMESTEAGIRECVNSPFWAEARRQADVAAKKQCQRVLDEALARVRK